MVSSWLTFSTPTTSMQSYNPAPMFTQASLIAEPPLEQADSIVEAGTSGIPSPDMIIGPRCPCFSDREKAFDTNPACISVGSIPALRIACFAASRASSLAERSDLPYLVLAALSTQTFLILNNMWYTTSLAN